MIRLRWWHAIAIAVAARLVLLDQPGHRGDTWTFGVWALLTTKRPLDHVYDTGPYRPDHLPSDLAAHAGLARAYTALGGSDFFGHGYELALKALPCVADLVLAGLVAMIVQSLRPGRAMPAFLVVALAPPMLVTSAQWGQWDSISLALAAGGVVLAQRRRLAVGSALVTLAVSVKPPLALPALVALVVLVAARSDRARLVGRTMTGITLGAGVAAGLAWPFGVGPLAVGPWRYGIGDLVRFASDRWPYRTMGAPNLWGALQGPKDTVLDSGVVIGVPAHTLGTLACGAGVLVVVGLALAAVRRGADAVVVAVLAVTASSWWAFEALTRVHERYALVPFVLSVVAVFLVPTWRTVVGVLALGAGTWVAVAGALADGGTGALSSGAWWSAIGLTFCGGLVFVGELLYSFAYPTTKESIINGY